MQRSIRSEYPSRKPDESDKAYLKRVLPSLPSPQPLPECQEDYFDCSNAESVLVSKLCSTKPADENTRSAANAAKAMTAAKAGVVAKRPPLRVCRRPDGNFDVLDGNATYTVAVSAGWITIPVIVDAEPCIREHAS